jgi:D-sedoheptulose 7-phosphate isomerase
MVMLNKSSRTEAALEAEVESLLRQELLEHRAAFEATATSIDGPFASALALLEATILAGGKVLLFGNGGSAADCQHIAAELVVRYKADRAPIAAIALTTDTSAITAGGNDFGFEAIFARQIEALGRPEDVAVGISTSGTSANVLRGLRQAKAKGMRTIGMSGASGGDMAGLCDCLILVPSPVTARIQEMHILVGHILCKALEQRLGLV